MSPPVWIDDPDARDLDQADVPQAILLKRMLRAGLSKFEPDPHAALQQKRKRRLKLRP
jgi:hypothetical protein